MNNIRHNTLERIRSIIEEDDFVISDLEDMRSEGLFNAEESPDLQEELIEIEEKATINAFANEYELSVARVRVAYRYAYREGHSSGHSEISGVLHDVLELYQDMSSV